MRQPVTLGAAQVNTRELLRGCLESLAGADADVWVVDNGSSDGTAEMVRSSFPAVTLVEAGSNLGFGAFHPCGYFCFAASSDTDGTMITSSPCCPVTGVAT